MLLLYCLSATIIKSLLHAPMTLSKVRFPKSNGSVDTLPEIFEGSSLPYYASSH